MKRIFLLFIFSILVQVYPQNLAGIKICLDPGHGFIPGQAANCSDAETKRFESWINHTTVPELKKYLLSEGATVITTRTDYDSIGQCITLTARKSIANNANATWFHSVHHNAFNGASNYSLVLYKQISTALCPNGNLAWPGKTDTMGIFMANNLYNSLYTTGNYNRGDSCFLGFNLGVLSTLSMPGTLSEGSFWDYQPEINRLRSRAYLRTEAEALYHSFLQYYKKPLPTHGSLVGIVSNLVNGSPLNKAKVVIKSENKTTFTDSLNNGFYRFDTLAPGAYTVSVYSGLDSTTVQVTVAGSKINKKNISFTVYSAPEDVKLKSVSISGTNLYTRWAKNIAAIDFYDVYMTTNPASWPASPSVSVPGTDTVGTIANVVTGTNYYIKVKARNALGSSPNFSKTYCAAKGNSSGKWLIVDGFNRFGGSGSNPTASHAFSGTYAVALNKLNASFESVSNNFVTDASYLQGNTYVLWYLGDEATVDETFSTGEQTYIKEYLKQGGNLLVSGSEIAWDLDNKGTSTDKEFFYNYLKSKYVADNPSPNTTVASGFAGSIFADIPQFSFGQVYPEDYADVIDTLNGSKPILKYNATQKAGIAFKGLFSLGSVAAKLIYIGFGIETMSDTSFISKIITLSDGFFRGTVAVEPDKSLIPSGFSAVVYPNPFNNATILQVHIPRNDYFYISLYSPLGALVKTIKSEMLTTGLYNIPVDLTGLSSGIYFVHIVSSQVNTSIKLNLIK